MDSAILSAHGRKDALKLCDLYEQAAELKAHDGDEDAAAFLLTQAYVFGLESNHPNASKLQEKLYKLGREVKPE